MFCIITNLLESQKTLRNSNNLKLIGKYQIKSIIDFIEHRMNELVLKDVKSKHPY